MKLRTQEGRAGTLRVDNALVFDGLNADLIEGSIYVENGRITALGETHDPAEQVLDVDGAMVIPGLIDAHFHAYGASLDLLELESMPRSYVALAARIRLEKTLRRGFTTVRDVAGGDAGLTSALAGGLVSGPRYLYTGPALSQTGGHGDPRPGELDLCPCHSHMSEIVDGVDPLRRAVRERFRVGAHAIKIMTSGGVVSPTDPIRMPQYSASEVKVVTEEAQRRGSYVAAHAYSPEAIKHSVENGVRSIEHGNLLDQESAEVMRQHAAFLVPTLAAYDALDRRGDGLGLSRASQAKNREVLDAGLRAVEIARASGVSIGFGTDLMGALEDDQPQGLRLQVEADGILEVLRSATSVNAELLGRGDLGRVKPGAVADLLVLDGNPFNRPAVLWSQTKSHTVIKGGRIVDPNHGW